MHCKDMQVAQHRGLVDPGADSGEIILRICTCPRVDRIVEIERYLYFEKSSFTHLKVGDGFDYKHAAFPLFICKGRVLPYQLTLRSVWELSVLIFLFTHGKDLEVINHSVFIIGLGEREAKIEGVTQFMSRRKSACGMSDPLQTQLSTAATQKL